MKTRKKRERKKNRTTIWLALFVVVIIVLIAILASNLPNLQQNVEKKQAAEYFQVPWSTVDDLDPDSPSPLNRTMVLIRAMTFNLTVVEKDAYGVVVLDLAGSGDNDLGVITKGQQALVQMEFANSYLSRWNAEHQGFAVTVRIKSVEAEGNLTFYIPLE